MKMFVAVGQNVMFQKMEIIDDTIMGRVISSGVPNFYYGDVILCKLRDVEDIIIHDGKSAVVVWSQKIKCKMIDKGEDK